MSSVFDPDHTGSLPSLPVVVPGAVSRFRIRVAARRLRSASPLYVCCRPPSPTSIVGLALGVLHVRRARFARIVIDTAQAIVPRRPAAGPLRP